MATITFTNNNNPNPGLEDVLDQNGDIITANATTFEIRNNNGGATNNFIFRFTSGDRASPSRLHAPTGGTITGGAILDSTGGDVVAILAGISNRSSEYSSGLRCKTTAPSTRWSSCWAGTLSRPRPTPTPARMATTI